MDRSNIELTTKKIIEFIEKNMTIVTTSKCLENVCKDSYLNKFNIIDILNGMVAQKNLSIYAINTFCNRYLKIYKEMVGHNIE